MAGYFFLLFTLTYGGFPWPPTLRDASAIVRPALMMGGAQAAGLVSYSFDSLLLGLLSGPAAVGLYNAAYKPVTAALAMPMTYYQGLFPALSRTFATSEDDFHKVIARSLALMSIFAVPLGIVGTFFSEPIINLLFGSAYSNSVPVLQILCWSAVLVTLRGTYRQGLLAAGKTNLDLRCGAISVFFNVGLNILLIPQFGIVGAAIATVSAEAIWLITVAWHFNRFVIRVNLHAVLLRPLAASGLLLGCLIGLQPMFWGLQASIGAVVYLGTLALLNSPGLRGINIFGPAFARED
jgi:O-antigen/teichoic acid export membrane protein